MRERPTLLAVALAAIVAGLAQAQQEDTAPIADVDLSLSRTSVFDVPAPPVPAVNVADPGDLPLVERAYASAPPLVPHAVADFMPITRDENWCVDCHDLDWMDPEEDEPTPVPFSHYMDLRGDSDDIGEEIVGARWVCVSCHVPVTDAPALVGSTFGE
jgi:cytochrome c-type protein NapB